MKSKNIPYALKKQYAVIDGTDGVVFIGDYKKAVEWYKKCVDDARDNASEAFSNPEDVTVRFLEVITSSQPEEVRDDEWVWVQGDAMREPVTLSEIDYEKD